MENQIEICTQNINFLLDTIEKILLQIGNNKLARADRENITHFETNYANFKNRISNDPTDIESAINSAKNSAIHAHGLALGISEKSIYSSEVKSTAQLLLDNAADFLKTIDSGDEFTGPYKTSIKKIGTPEETKQTSSVTDHEKHIIELRTKIQTEIEAFERNITKGTNEIEQIEIKSNDNYKKSNEEILELRKTIESLKNKISSLQGEMKEESSKAAKISEDAEEYSKNIHSKIDDLLGQGASKVLLIDYANTADTEKNSADTMRYWSLACMGLTGIVLCYALYESLSIGLDWKQALFKAFTAIALSLPAAYLARESTRHRIQEHINRRISLDLRAITPYIATLPTEEQNRIKSEVASKIFGIQDNINTSTDNFPINAQELIKSMIDKIPSSK